MSEEQQNQFKNVQQLINGIDIDLSVIVMTDNGVPAMDDFRKNVLSKYQSYEISDFTKTDYINIPQSVIEENNSVVSCTQDQWNLRAEDCTYSPVSTSESTETDFWDTQYCIVVPSFSHQTVSTRYNIPYGQCASKAIPDYAQLKKSIEQHDSLLESISEDLYYQKNSQNKLKGKMSPSINELQHSLYNDLMTANIQLKEIQASMKETLGFVNDDKEGLSGLMNCTVIRREAQMLMGGICYDFGIKIGKMSIILGLGIGPLLLLMAFCVCWSASKTRRVIEQDLRAKQAQGYNYI